MVILGIDPGLQITGFGVLTQKSGTTFLLDHGYLKLKSTNSVTERIGTFHAFIEEKVNQWQVSHLVLETPFLGKNAQNFLKLGYLRGILHLVANQQNLTISEYAPREVKQAVTGFGGASKDQVARIVLQLFPRIGNIAKQDVTDALAVTLCGLWRG